MANVSTGYTLHNQAANVHPTPKPRYAQDAEYSTSPEVVPQVQPYEQYKYPIEAHQESPESSKKSTMLRLRKSTFILSMLLAVVIIIALVGGGVGGVLAVKRAKGSNNCPANLNTVPTAIQTLPDVSSTSIPSTSINTNPSSPTSSGFTLPTNAILPLDCPNMNGSTQVVTLGSQSWTFKIECNVDFLGPVTIMAVTVYSLNDCLRACASYNRNSNSNGCIAAEFGANMTFLEPNDFGTCFLKNATGTVFISGSNPNPHAAGVLTSSPVSL